VNPAVEKLLGYSREDVLARPYIEFVHPEDRERTVAEAARVETGEAAMGFENRLVGRDGSARWVSWSSVTAREEQLVYAVGRDTTAEKQIAAALAESEERHRELVESARDAIFSIAADGRIVSLNSAFQTVTGWLREERIGRRFAEVLHPDDAGLASRIFETVMRGEPVRTFELRVRGRDDVHVPMELTVTAQRRGEEIVGVLGIARDVRERHRMEEQLRQIQRPDSVGRLAAGIAHDFNNLLTVQQGHLSLLLMEPGLPAPVVEHVQETAAAAERAAALTQQLLLFSRKRPLQRQRVDLNEVVSTLARMLDRVVGEDVAIEIRTDGHLPQAGGPMPERQRPAAPSCAPAVQQPSRLPVARGDQPNLSISSSALTVAGPNRPTTMPAASLASRAACGAVAPAASARPSVAIAVSPAPVTSATSRAVAGR
jgi:PAS domain S-box-containing protein